MNSVEMTVTHTSSDLTIWGLFAADPFVKLVMLLLVWHLSGAGLLWLKKLPYPTRT